MTTDEPVARRFVQQLFNALCTALSDPVAVRSRVEELHDHAAVFPETLRSFAPQKTSTCNPGSSG